MILTLVSEQSKNKANAAIEEAKCLQLSRDTIRSRVVELQKIIADLTSADYEVATAQMDLPRQKASLVQAIEKVKAKEKALGVDGRWKLDRPIS